MVTPAVAGSPVAFFEARRRVVDEELALLADEHANIEALQRQLQRRKEILDGRWKPLMAERDLLDQRIWDGQTPPSGPKPPVVPTGAAARGPRDLASEPWDFEGLELAS